MFGRTFKLFTISGFSVGIDASWFIIAILVAWSLAAGVFPFYYPDLQPGTYWAMGILGAAGLFASIVLHELSHAKAAARFDLPMKGITLFIFGGVAEMQEEPARPGAEFWMAIAGPIMSIVIAAVCGGVYWLGQSQGWPSPVNGVVGWLAWINFILVVFNMVPAFPLDGGRILRAGLWKWRSNLRWATRVTSTIGSAFGILLIVLGLFSFISGNLIGGVWWFLIGMFLRSAAQMSYRQMLVRQMLEGEPIRRFMHQQPDTVPGSASITELVEDHVYRLHHKMFPVVENGGHLVGCVSTRQIRAIPKEQWNAHTVSEVMERCSNENTVRPDEDAMRTLSRMNRSGRSRMLVVDGEQLEGVVSLKDLTRFIALKLDIEEEQEAAA